MIKLYKTQRELVEAASMALKNRMYVSGWYLSSVYKHLREYPNVCVGDVIAIKFVNELPVAIAVTECRTIMAFCKREHRKNGFASECVNAIKNDTKGNYTAGLGVDGSFTFWRRCGIHAC
jgi:hypothetical protein